MTRPFSQTAPDDSATGHSRGRLSRRRFVGAAAVAGLGAAAGCFAPPSDGGGPVSLADFRGSGPLVEARAAPGGTSIADLPDLSGELSLYLGGGESGLYIQLFDLLERYYEDFSVSVNPGTGAGLASTIIEETEADVSRADVFLAIEAGSLSRVANAGAAVPLPGGTADAVPAAFKSEHWVGIAGRARSVPYNTDELSAAEVPDAVADFPDTDAFEGSFGWAPTYGAFQSFVTAMRLLRGEAETRRWLEAMQDLQPTTWPDEFRVSNGVADGAAYAGFANHYYALRVRNARPDAPIDITFTKGDAGALVNVAGVELVKGTEKRQLAADFIRHLLSAEAQEFFATQTFAYPTVPDVEPAGDLPPISELDPPEVDLTKLSDAEPTLSLLRDTNVL